VLADGTPLGVSFGAPPYLETGVPGQRPSPTPGSLALGRPDSPAAATLRCGQDHSPTVIVIRFEGTAPFSRLQIGKPKFMLAGIGL
jgi:hypothetical protein